MTKDWYTPGDLTARLNKRFDEIYITQDEDAMRVLDVEIMHVLQTWLHMLVRQAKASGDFDRAVHVKHVAHLIQRETTHARKEHEKKVTK